MISWVASVTMKGWRLNLATKKPLIRPMMAPTTRTIRTTSRIQPGVMAGRFWNILREISRLWSMVPAMAAVRPTTRPADRSVPVRTMHPPIPSAMGREAAARETMLMMEPGFTKLLFLTAV